MFHRSFAAIALMAGLVSGGAANANLLLNAGFETGSFTSWGTTGDAVVAACAPTVIGCAPSGGTYLAALNNITFGVGNASVTQSVILPGAGSYSFGAYLSFGTNSAPANFDQGQISLTIQLAGGASETVGFDPNALNGQFTIAGFSGFSFTPWMLLSDTLIYNGVGPVSAIINLNVQDFPNNGGTTLAIDNAFIEMSALPEPTPVPEPATMTLLAGSLLGFGAMRRRRKSA